ncbi:MAG: beta-ketoacyl synthase N-terminal-like domain-containing protein [Cyanobacteria bacterium J06638_38]
MDLSPTKKALLALRQMQSKLDAMEQAKHEPIAIVGLGCRFPGANNPEEFWQLLQEGRDAIAKVPDDRWKETEDGEAQLQTLVKNGANYGGFVPNLKEFDASFFRIAPREAASLDPQQRLLLEVSWEALENGAIAPEGIRGSQTGVFIGVSAIDYWQQLLSRQPTEIDAYLTTGNTHSLASGRISHFFDFTGASISLDTACSSSLVAVHLAIKSLREGECHLALAGGVNRLISPKISVNFARAKMLSIEGKCKTFDEAANGFVRSEGCGIVVLKRLSDAIADQDRIRAILLGSATNQDGRTSSITTPNSLSQQAVIKQALVNSKTTAPELSYVETHGTGTSLGDAIEIEALSQVFSGNKQLTLGAVKTNIGHLESASGIASLIKTVLALENETIPGNLHLEQPNHQVDWANLPFKLPQTAISWQRTNQPRRAGVSGFGFSGTNAHLIVQEADLSTYQKSAINNQAEHLERASHLFTLSARSNKALIRLASEYVDYLQSHVDLLIEDVCLTANLGRSHFNHRLAVKINSVPDLQAKLTQYLAQEITSELWHNRANLNRETTLAVTLAPEQVELKHLIESVIHSSLVSATVADIHWQIGKASPQASELSPKLINTPIESEFNHWQVLITGLAQLYVLGVSINWDALCQISGGKKITLPTYPFQRAVYWLE